MNDNLDDLSREAKLDEIIAEFLQAKEREGPQDHRQWVARYPDFAAELAEFFADHDRLDGFAKEVSQPPTVPPAPQPEPESIGDLTNPLIPFPAQRSQPEIGGIFAGQYRTFGIKAGGMGRVYLADVVPLHRGDIHGKIAIKIIPDFEEWRERQTGDKQPSDRAAYERVSACFRQEAATWVKIGKRQNVIWAFFVMDVGGKPYIFMEYAEEGDLRSWIAQGRITTPLAVNLAVQFCRGMIQAIEACGLVHRDIKPANVLLTNGHLLKVSDFGLSKAYDAFAIKTAGQGSLGQSSALSHAAAGTVAYMAPEQFLSLSNADTRSDIYSFGVMLFEMVTGHQLFGAMSFREHLLQRGRPAPVLHDIKPGVPAALSSIVARCLAFDPELRPPSAAALAVALRKELKPFRRALRWMAVHRRAVLAAAAVAMCALLGVAAFCILRPPYSVRQLRQGVAYYEAGRDEFALDCLNASLRIEPHSREALIARARVYQHLGDYSPALADYEAADQLIPSSGLDACLGYCLNQSGQDEAATAYYRRALAAGENSPAVLNNLGFSCFQLHQLEDAESCLRRAFQADDTLQAPHCNLVLVFLQRALEGKDIPGEAFLHSRRALEIGPPSGGLYRDMAFLYAVAAKHDAAAAQVAIGYVAKSVALGMDPEVFKSEVLFLGLKQDPAFQAALIAPVLQKTPEAVHLIDPSSQRQ